MAPPSEIGRATCWPLCASRNAVPSRTATTTPAADCPTARYGADTLPSRVTCAAAEPSAGPTNTLPSLM